MSNYKFRCDDNIGNLDAESDSFLESCFIESKTYNALLREHGIEKWHRWQG